MDLGSDPTFRNCKRTHPHPIRIFCNIEEKFDDRQEVSQSNNLPQPEEHYHQQLPTPFHSIGDWNHISKFRHGKSQTDNIKQVASPQLQFMQESQYAPRYRVKCAINLTFTDTFEHLTVVTFFSETDKPRSDS